MNKKQKNEFLKRYEKFKKCNLPVRFFDNERQVLEYVYYRNTTSNEKELYINSLTEALGNIVSFGFYYSYTCGYFKDEIKDGKIVNENSIYEICHRHAHSFEEVVSDLYNYPENFSISKEEEVYFSKQELEYLHKVQKYLLFIGIKDSPTNKISRFQNKKQEKYGDCLIRTFTNKAINDILRKKRNFTFCKLSDEQYRHYKEKEDLEINYQALIVDSDYNFKFFIQYTKQEVMEYKDIKHMCQNKDYNDDDKILVEYFKILEVF